MKRIVTMQDISCIGKCSLTVALPIISAMGIETAVIPTAVLSTHTGFSDFTFRDLTEDIPKIIEHWSKKGFELDAVYSGYLGSLRQIELVRELFCRFHPVLRFVDPAMADDGKLYTGFDQKFVQAMAKLCADADVMIPNMTEACLLCGKTYEPDADEAFIREILKELGKRGTHRVIITGVHAEPDLLGAMCYDSQADSYISYYNEKISAHFHGTGDIFASCMTGSLVRNASVEKALKLSVDYTLECIRATMREPEHNWYGVNFEQALPFLIKNLP